MESKSRPHTRSATTPTPPSLPSPSLRHPILPITVTLVSAHDTVTDLHPCTHTSRTPSSNPSHLLPVSLHAFPRLLCPVQCNEHKFVTRTYFSTSMFARTRTRYASILCDVFRRAESHVCHDFTPLQKFNIF